GAQSSNRAAISSSVASCTGRPTARASISGSTRLGPAEATAALPEGRLAVLGAGDSLRLVPLAPDARLLLLAAAPLAEPVVRHG
ncbi:pirin-like C-terminal cupin domain-containing protein, partial [Escherichia coli]|uniref:pirin-like C-terminal cupin domain-containing protein n=1 Tax=Escherichia coli TaxID=562 RepID=UPI0018084915|nr:hypothetical protein [Escherichia coli]